MCDIHQISDLAQILFKRIHFQSNNILRLKRDSFDTTMCNKENISKSSPMICTKSFSFAKELVFAGVDGAKSHTKKKLHKTTKFNLSRISEK